MSLPFSAKLMLLANPSSALEGRRCPVDSSQKRPAGSASRPSVGFANSIFHAATSRYGGLVLGTSSPSRRPLEQVSIEPPSRSNFIHVRAVPFDRRTHRPRRRASDNLGKPSPTALLPTGRFRTNEIRTRRAFGSRTRFCSGRFVGQWWVQPVSATVLASVAAGVS